LNTLQHYLHAQSYDEIDAMNTLQDHGIVSDNCVTAAEVGDTGKAVSFLNNLPPEHKPKKIHKTK
jgi:hypothetical protein